MTNEEAIEIMSKVTFYWELGNQTLTQNQINEALDMAIKALEQKSALDKIREEISERADRLRDSLYGDGMRHCIEIIDEYKSRKREREGD